MLTCNKDQYSTARGAGVPGIALPLQRQQRLYGEALVSSSSTRRVHARCHWQQHARGRLQLFVHGICNALWLGSGIWPSGQGAVGREAHAQAYSMMPSSRTVQTQLFHNCSSSIYALLCLRVSRAFAADQEVAAASQQALSLQKALLNGLVCVPSDAAAGTAGRRCCPRSGCCRA
jgi:hypothetical protein